MPTRRDASRTSGSGAQTRARGRVLPSQTRKYPTWARARRARPRSCLVQAGARNAMIEQPKLETCSGASGRACLNKQQESRPDQFSPVTSGARGRPISFVCWCTQYRTSVRGSSPGSASRRAQTVLYATMFISLDGVVSDPHMWHPRFMSEESVVMLGEQLDEADAMLLGRRTYQDFASYWPYQDDAVPLARRTNEIRKFVVSGTRAAVEWANTSFVGADPVAAATQLKKAHECIMLAGGPTLVRSLLAQGALDEMRLYLDPIVIGSGQRLFNGGPAGVSFERVDCRELPNGVQYLAYRARR